MHVAVCVCVYVCVMDMLMPLSTHPPGGTSPTPGGYAHSDLEYTVPSYM